MVQASTRESDAIHRVEDASREFLLAVLCQSRPRLNITTITASSITKTLGPGRHRRFGGIHQWEGEPCLACELGTRGSTF